jgi:hypothetical protein
MTLRGVMSGDHECWCFLVDRVTFMQLTKTKPARYDVGPFAKRGSPYRYKIYLDHMIADTKGEPVDLTVIVRKVR